MNDNDNIEFESAGISADFKKVAIAGVVAVGLFAAFYAANRYVENAKLREINLGLNQIYDQSLLEK